MLAVEAKPLLKLNLGAHRRARSGYVNVDYVEYPGIDVVADLEKRWPFDDESVSEIFCNDFPEHLRQVYEEPNLTLMIQMRRHAAEGDYRQAFEDLFNAVRQPTRTYGIIHFFNEAYRVLVKGGTLEAKIPSTDGRGWAQDPTHVSYWNQNTLRYFVPTCGESELYKDQLRGRWNIVYLNTEAPNTIGVTNLCFELEKGE